MIATSHPEASQIGVAVLRRGRTAMDAAIDASAMLCVFEPAMTGVGGDCCAIVVPLGGQPRSIP
jgi:gamma-glutamyltranspeptidase/glutathione hydrolase